MIFVTASKSKVYEQLANCWNKRNYRKNGIIYIEDVNKNQYQKLNQLHTKI